MARQRSHSIEFKRQVAQELVDEARKIGCNVLEGFVWPRPGPRPEIPFVGLA